ncbi:hypothetical protein CFN78_28120 [Amycolatopsis antarctica]|uniref:Uncharacterized protein n=1 Tax=Amycolatopsis antarctica TaxID=1854586 RepID=A0A263CUU2_9PSEU|nr:hypothetical protein [Amycolatopsis antarctica]OZM69893.1 hypothetical protein CFN78_28120 [Amycolatopsis antarctica]
MKTCKHGEYPGTSTPDIVVNGHRERAVAKHEKKCPGAHFFWHPGTFGLGRVVCCITCRQRVL